MYGARKIRVHWVVEDYIWQLRKEQEEEEWRDLHFLIGRPSKIDAGKLLRHRQEKRVEGKITPSSSSCASSTRRIKTFRPESSEFKTSSLERN